MNVIKMDWIPVSSRSKFGLHTCYPKTFLVELYQPNKKIRKSIAHSLHTFIEMSVIVQPFKILIVAQTNLKRYLKHGLP